MGAAPPFAACIRVGSPGFDFGAKNRKGQGI